MEFARDYLVHYYEADCLRRLTLPGLIQYFEDISILHTTSIGYDLAFYDANDCGWMLLKWDVRIHRLPLFGDTVRVSTSVHAMKRFLSERVYSVHAADGTLVADARSVWLLVDTVKRRPMRVPEEQYERYGISPASEKDFIMIDDVDPPVLPATSPESDSLVWRRSILTGNSDIDTNSHVNNVRYLAWALDSLPRKFATDFSPVSMRVHYKKELNLGDAADILTVESLPDGDGPCATTHSIVKGADEICNIVISWKKA